MHELGGERLFSIWEHGLMRHPLDRALLLLALAAPDVATEGLADMPLGERNARLMRLREQWFGNCEQFWSDCSACGERMALEIHADALPPTAVVDDVIEVDGLTYRLPTSRDLASLTAHRNTAEAARVLLRHCAEQPARLPDDELALDALVEQVGAALDRADPWAELSLHTRCPACDADNPVALDFAALLWDDIECLARRLLDEVHLLAQAYGWRERDILALGESRRAAYLARLQ